MLSRPNKEVLAEFYPSVPFKKEIGPNETLLSIEKARRVLGYEPHYSGGNKFHPENSTRLAYAAFVNHDLISSLPFVFKSNP